MTKKYSTFHQQLALDNYPSHAERSSLLSYSMLSYLPVIRLFLSQPIKKEYSLRIAYLLSIELQEQSHIAPLSNENTAFVEDKRPVDGQADVLLKESIRTLVKLRSSLIQQKFKEDLTKLVETGEMMRTRGVTAWYPASVDALESAIEGANI
jgi:hypothetical protein